MEKQYTEYLRKIPPVHEIIKEAKTMNIVEEYGQKQVTEVIRGLIDEYRQELKTKGIYERDRTRESIKGDLIKCLQSKLQQRHTDKLQKIINATGIVMHTNMGRAPLPAQAIEMVKEISEGYSNLEYNLVKGQRGSRYCYIEELLKDITGAESAMVVNNNAAAVFLTLNTIAKDKQVIVSRGEQVEIGGSFRIPDIIGSSGASMVEVGTTNKTHLFDYENAIGEDVAVLLKVHTSNYKMIGFTESVDTKELAKLAKKSGLYSVEDLGSGNMMPRELLTMCNEPTVQQKVKDGLDIITFSGDKLLGGPQVGIIVGKKTLVDRIKKNPLARMLRCDKMTISALMVILEMYKEPNVAVSKIPVLTMLAISKKELETRAYCMMQKLQDAVGKWCSLRIIDVQDQPGGGSLPGTILQGRAVAIKPLIGDAGELKDKLRRAKTPVICIVRNNEVVFSMRTIREIEYEQIVEMVQWAVRREK